MSLKNIVNFKNCNYISYYHNCGGKPSLKINVEEIKMKNKINKEAGRNTNRIFFVSLIITSLLITSSIPNIVGIESNLDPIHVIETENLKITVESNIDITKINYEIKNYNTEKVLIEGKEYVKIFIEDESKNLDKGYPDIPNICRSVIIPERAKMNVEVIQYDYKIIDKIDIIPSKGIFSMNSDPNDIPYEFASIYDQDSWYPENLVELGEPFIMRDFRGVKIMLCPFQYNPVQKQLKFISSIEVKLTSVGNDGRNQYHQDYELNDLSSSFIPVYENCFLNYYNLDGGNNKFGSGEKMLIICPPAYYDTLQDFKDWKDFIGISTEIATTSQTGTSSSEIKSYIKNYYNTNGLDYVILAGDSDDVATHIFSKHISQGGLEYGRASDQEYSYLVGNDCVSDIFVGRFPAASEIQLEEMTEKTISYEHPLPGQWYYRGTGIASEVLCEGEYDWEHMRYIRNNTLLPSTYTSVDEFYDGSHGGEDADGDPPSWAISLAINYGRSIVNYCGHGEWDRWTTGNFNNYNVKSLWNYNKYPFVISVACHTGAFHEHDECFCEAWIRDGYSGAIAITGSSGSMLKDIPKVAQKRMNTVLGYNTVGSIHLIGLNAMSGYFANDERRAWNIFGDPSIEIITVSPPQPIIADFYWSPSEPTDLDDVHFYDQSTPSAGGTINQWEWRFGDENISYEQNPVHRYADDGYYDVKLTVWDTKGKTDYKIKEIYIRNVPPVLNYTIKPSVAVVGDTINFNSTSYDQDGYIVNTTWDFGDGNISYETNTTHEYTQHGFYDVTITVTDDDNAKSIDTVTVLIVDAMVDDDYEEDDPETHKWNKVQEGIDDSVDGDWIYVWNGTYQEEVMVDTSVSMYGEHRDGVIIQGERIGITIFDAELYLNGFTVECAHDIGIYSSAENNDEGDNVFENCRIAENGIGFMFDDTSNNVVKNSIVFSNEIGINIINGAYNNLIRDCDIQYTDYSIIICSSNNSTIYNDTILHSEVCGISILDNSCYNKISKSEVSSSDIGIEIKDGSQENGISGSCEIWYNNVGISIEDSENNWIGSNPNGPETDAFCDFGFNNVAISLENAGETYIHRCYIDANTLSQFPPPITSGILIEGTDYSTISGCVVFNATGYAICSDLSMRNRIDQCVIYNNDKGIFLKNSSQYTVKNCSLLSNVGWAVAILGESLQNQIYFNNFIENGGPLSGNQAYDEGEENRWYYQAMSQADCKGNYWSDYQGQDNNGDGIGDTPYRIPGPARSYDLYPVMEHFEWE